MEATNLATTLTQEGEKNEPQPKLEIILHKDTQCQ